MKVLIAVDDSRNSRLAVDAVTRRRFEKPVSFKILHIVEPFDPIEPSAITPSQEWANFVERERKAMKDDAYRLLLDAAESLREHFPDSEIESQIIDGFTPADLIVSLAEEWSADLIFVGSRGHKGLQRLLLGSVSHSVALQAACTVEVVRRETDNDDSSALQLNNILIAIDDSDCSSAAIEMFVRQHWGENTNFKVITVTKPAAQLLGIELDSLLKAAVNESEQKENKLKHERLKEAASKIAQGHNPESVSFDLLTGDAREVILQTASDWPADLIVVGSRGRNRLTRLLLGSVSHAILLHSQCSIQIVKD